MSSAVDDAGPLLLGRRSLTSDTKLDVCRFAECDRDADRHLDADEFYAMMPPRVRNKFTAEQIRSWFEASDVDGDGFIGINDYFRWSLCNVCVKHGREALRLVFEKYDKDKTGMLDALEFEAAAEELGFGKVGHELFRDLDDDGSGCVTYTELLENLSEGSAAAKTMSADVKAVHSALRATYDEDTKEQRVGSIETSRWVVKGKDAPTVLEELRRVLAGTDAHVIDLIKCFDVDADAKLCIDDMEFYSTLKTTFGFTGELSVLQEVFGTLDADASGRLGYDDFYHFVRGFPHSLDDRKNSEDSSSTFPLRLEPPAPQRDIDGLVRSPALDEILWDAEALRTLIRHMLHTRGLGTVDLLKAWDTADARERSTLTRSEFMSHVKELVVVVVAPAAADAATTTDEGDNGAALSTLPALSTLLDGSGAGDDKSAGAAEAAASEDLWESEVRLAAAAAFDDILREVKGGNAQGNLGIVHLEKWLNDPSRRPVLPLKTHAQLIQQAKRRELHRAQEARGTTAPSAAELARAAAARAAKIQEQADAAIEYAKGKASARQAAARRAKGHEVLLKRREQARLDKYSRATGLRPSSASPVQPPWTRLKPLGDGLPNPFRFSPPWFGSAISEGSSLKLVTIGDRSTGSGGIGICSSSAPQIATSSAVAVATKRGTSAQRRPLLRGAAEAKVACPPSDAPSGGGDSDGGGGGGDSGAPSGPSRATSPPLLPSPIWQRRASATTVSSGHESRRRRTLSAHGSTRRPQSRPQTANLLLSSKHPLLSGGVTTHKARPTTATSRASLTSASSSAGAVGRAGGASGGRPYLFVEMPPAPANMKALEKWRWRGRL